MSKILEKMSITRFVVLGFLAVITIGAILLSLPISSATGEATNFLDAFFVATSAVCVTGQTTVNTALHWNYFGKTVIITLIEIGGLGFMSVVVLFFSFLKKQLNLKHRLLVSESLSVNDISDATRLVHYVLKFSFVVQAIGALLLSIRMLPRYGLIKGIYFSIFHSISAYCNAGFDLFGDSMISFQNDPLILLTIAFLIIAGGLGFIVWRDVLSYHKTKKLRHHSRLALIMTGIVLLSSFIFIAISESQHGTFAHLAWNDRIVNYFFMAVTPRTAGYVNVDYRLVSHFGVFITIILMFMGGISGSTAGGIKLTTLGVAFISVWCIIKNKKPQYRFRTISKTIMIRAFMIIVIGIILVTSSSLILLMTEQIPPGLGIEYILMEVFSCFGTVGITMGLTPDLTAIGKMVLILLMFAGRVGLLSFFISFNTKEDRDKHIKYPDMKVLVG